MLPSLRGLVGYFLTAVPTTMRSINLVIHSLSNAFNYITESIGVIGELNHAQAALNFYHRGKQYQLTVTNNFGCSLYWRMKNFKHGSPHWLTKKSAKLYSLR